MTENRPRESGFTLIELLIAVTVMAIVTAQLFMVFSSQKRTFHANQRSLDVQEDARLVLDLIAFDARQAGFMVPRSTGISSEDGGTAAADRFCISDPNYFPYPAAGGAPSQLDSRADHFSTTGATSVDANTVVVVTLDIDGSQAFAGTSPNDFTIGSGVIVSDGQTSVCARIDSIDEPNRSLELDKDYNALLGMTVGVVRVTPAILYAINAASNTLTRNGLTLATSVEDLQVEYWVDNRIRNGQIEGAPSGDPSTEFPIHDLNSAPAGWVIDTSRIRRIRVSVLTATNMREVNPDGTEKITAYSGRPALANRIASTQADGFQRRRFVASVTPRNLM